MLTDNIASHKSHQVPLNGSEGSQKKNTKVADHFLDLMRGDDRTGVGNALQRPTNDTAENQALFDERYLAEEINKEVQLAFDLAMRSSRMTDATEANPPQELKQFALGKLYYTKHTYDTSELASNKTRSELGQATPPNYSTPTFEPETYVSPRLSISGVTHSCAGYSKAEEARNSKTLTSETEPTSPPIQSLLANVMFSKRRISIIETDTTSHVFIRDYGANTNQISLIVNQVIQLPELSADGKNLMITANGKKLTHY